MAASEEGSQKVAVKWSGKQFEFELASDATVASLKHCIERETRVQSKRQKLLNLKQGTKMAEDDAILAQLKMPKVVMVMGTPDDVLQQNAAEAEAAPEVIDDFDVGDDVPLNYAERPEYVAKLKRRIDTYKLKVLNPPREGKKCLVLDIDYTLFDHRSAAERPEELMRPFLHEFLTAAYEHYDIIIWSATGLKWVEVKMKELGVLSNPNYKVTLLMDGQAMITVHHETYGVFDCKPLGWVWANFPDNYGPHNTIMFDDLRRNFIMNPQNGLKIRPFAHAHRSRETDRELVHLTEYLLAIAPLQDLSSLDHNRLLR